MIAYDYPILGVFWSLLIFFLWIAWIMLLFRVIADIFRADNIGGFSKALWAIFVVIVPWLGVLIYMLVHGDDMARRQVEDAQSQEAVIQDYIRNAAGTTSAADEIAKLSALHANGTLTAEEFQAQKARLLA